MPIYEYQCEACQHCFERLVFAGDEDVPADCPECGETRVKRLISCTSFIGAESGGLCSSGSSTGFS